MKEAYSLFFIEKATNHDIPILKFTINAPKGKICARDQLHPMFLLLALETLIDLKDTRFCVYVQCLVRADKNIFFLGQILE